VYGATGQIICRQDQYQRPQGSITSSIETQDVLAPMSDRPGNSSRQFEDMEPVQTHESKKRALDSWLATKRKKTHDDASSRRPGRGREYPEMPGEENHDQSLGIFEGTLQQWSGRKRSRDSSIHSATSEDNIDHENPTSEPFFVVPYAPTQHYLHQRFYEDRLYKMLLVGGTRIAFMGETGVGYGISERL
jgi:hypothetical protein